MSYLYNTFLYNPLLNILVFFYNTIAFKDFGLTIIFFTIFIRTILFPLFHKSARHQVVMQRLQPELKKIQEKHKGDLDRQGRESMALYKEHNINPLFGFLFLLIQLPIMIALYQIFSSSSHPDFFSSLYNLVPKPESLNTSFLGLINLSERNIIMVGLAAIAQYFQGVLSLPKAPKDRESTTAENIGRQIVFIAPFMTLLIFYKLPAAVSLYWLVTTIFSVIQQVFINRKTNNSNSSWVI